MSPERSSPQNVQPLPSPRFDRYIFRVILRFLNCLSHWDVLKRNKFCPSNKLVTHINDNNKWDIPELIVSESFS